MGVISPGNPNPNPHRNSSPNWRYGDDLPAKDAVVVAGSSARPHMTASCNCWAAVGCYLQPNRLWRMAAQENVFEKPDEDVAGWQLMHGELQENKGWYRIQ